MKEYFYLSKKKKESILTQINSILKKESEVVFVFCHGSFLEKKEIGFQDIDIAVYLKGKIKERDFEKSQKIADILEKKVKYPVDVKVLNSAPFYFLNSVFRTGKLLFSRDNRLLTELIEQSSLQSMINYEFSLNSLRELIS